MPVSRGESGTPKSGLDNPEGFWISRWVEVAHRRTRHPFLASTLVFGLLPSAVVVTYALLRWRSLDVGFAFSLGAVVVVLVAAPYLIWYYDTRLLPTFFGRITTLLVDEDRVDALATRHRQLLTDGWWIASFLAALPVPVLVFGSPSFHRAHGLFGPTDPLFWLVLVVLTWIGVLVGIGFLMVLITVSIARTLANEELRVDPLHPDGLGGMSPIGYLSIRTTILFSLGSLLLPLLLQYAAGTGPRLTVLIYGMGVIYATFIALSFLFPTVVVSRQAAEVRTDVLEDLRSQYIDVKQRAGEPSIGANPETTDPEVEQKLQRIRHEHTDYRRVNLYPMDMSILVRLTGSVLLPLSFILLDTYLRPDVVERLLAISF